jgi:uncharacterized protein (TIGR02217 family)
MPIQDDDAVTFPACPTYGFSVDPSILVKIVSREGGFERLDRKWAHPRRRYDGIPVGEKPQADIEEILHFFLAVGGMSTYFRFKDWTDYKSCSLDDEVTPLDQPFSFESGSPGGYRLIKRYSIGPFTYDRPIYRPIGTTIRVANQSGTEQAESTWILQESTGLLAPLGTFTGTPTSWGGEFDVMVRFNAPFIPEISNFKIQKASVSLIEKRESTS